MSEHRTGQCFRPLHNWNEKTGKCFCGELERCVIVFKNNRRCTHSADPATSLCNRHKDAFDAVKKMSQAVARGMKGT